MQTDIFDYLYTKKHIIKPIRLIELFSGYGSQSLALKYLNVEYKSWKTCEWAINSIAAYNDLHIQDYDSYYDGDMDKAMLVRELLIYGVSRDYNKPMTEKELLRLSDDQLRTIYNNIIVTNDLVNIQNVQGGDLDIEDTESFNYLMSYSFPCQDLSINGTMKGMSDNTTRSGMLWEVERILSECKEKPQILLMENVPQVHSKNNIDDFRKWQLSLEKMGYKNYWKDLNAKNFGIPQNRNRCFMVSILQGDTYKFPSELILKHRLKDILEPNVDNRYDFDKPYKITNEPNIVARCYLETFDQNTRVFGEESIFQCLSARERGTNKVLIDNRIRKLTSRECFRLMGVKDSDSCKINQSHNSLVHIAGDSIVTTVLMAIFGELLGIDYQTKINELLKEITNE